jgi:hypothetical protein
MFRNGRDRIYKAVPIFGNMDEHAAGGPAIGVVEHMAFPTACQHRMVESKVTIGAWTRAEMRRP